MQAAFPDAESVNEVPANADESCPPTDAKTDLNFGETDTINEMIQYNKAANEQF